MTSRAHILIQIIPIEVFQSFRTKVHVLVLVAVREWCAKTIFIIDTFWCVEMAWPVSRYSDRGFVHGDAMEDATDREKLFCLTFTRNGFLF